MRTRQLHMHWIGLPSRTNYIDEIPDSLQEALCIFFLSVSIGRKLGDDKGNPKNRSMMIHPSQYREGHDRYYDWVRTTKANWEKVKLQAGISLKGDRTLRDAVSRT